MVTVGVGVSTYLIFDKQLTEMRTARESGNKATADQLSIMQTQAAAMQRQLDELRESNRINLETLRSVQRPFVTSPSVFVRPIEVNGTNLGWRIGPTFYNSGNTPASGVRTWVNYFSPKEGCDLPVGFSVIAHPPWVGIRRAG
jgi:hypothetical protein